MKKTGIVLLLAGLSIMTTAQENTLSLGLRTGLGLSHMSYGEKVPYLYKNIRQNESFSFGMEARMPISTALGLITGIQYSERGYGMQILTKEIVRYNYTYLDYLVGVEYLLYKNLHLKTSIEISNLRQFSTNINLQDVGEYRVDPSSLALGLGIGALYHVHPNVFVAFQMTAGKLGSVMVQSPINVHQATYIDQFYINPMLSVGYRYHFKSKRVEEETDEENTID